MQKRDFAPVLGPLWEKPWMKNSLGCPTPLGMPHVSPSLRDMGILTFVLDDLM